MIPAGERVYAIGDIHGRDDLFAELLDRIEADDKGRSAAHTTLILLGDLVDRGPASASVVERALALGRRFDTVRYIVGNHEECFLAALTGDVARVRYFVRIGGDSTIRSYWGDDDAYAAATFEEVAEQLPRLVPKAHVDFLGHGEDMICIGNYCFVHAGLRPGVDLDKQKTSDLRWIREDFLRAPSKWGAIVVHGHTIQGDVDWGSNRIGIDTGAYASGKLTALGLEGARQWILQAQSD